MCLWKGVGSSMWVTAIQIGSETAICELTSGKLPRELTSNYSLNACMSHLALKTIAAIITAPFYSTHLVESVQVCATVLTVVLRSVTKCYMYQFVTGFYQLLPFVITCYSVTIPI